jgi:hypothetical protein
VTIHFLTESAVRLALLKNFIIKQLINAKHVLMELLLSKKEIDVNANLQLHISVQILFA